MKRKWKKLLAGVCAAAMGLTMFSTAGIPAQSVQARAGERCSTSIQTGDSTEGIWRMRRTLTLTTANLRA